MLIAPIVPPSTSLDELIEGLRGIGDKVLLVAHLTPGHLAIYPPRALHAFFDNHRRLLEA